LNRKDLTVGYDADLGRIGDNEKVGSDKTRSEAQKVGMSHLKICIITVSKPLTKQAITEVLPLDRNLHQS